MGGPLRFPTAVVDVEPLVLTLRAFTEVGDRRASMRRVVEGLTEAELDRTCGRKPAEPYPDREYVARRCLKVVLKEEAEHHRYALRELAVLKAGERTG